MAQVWKRLSGKLQENGVEQVVSAKKDWFDAFFESLRCAPFTTLVMQELEKGFEVFA